VVWVLLMTDLNLTINFSRGDEFKVVKESELRKSRTLSTYWFLFKTNAIAFVGFCDNQVVVFDFLAD